MQPFGTEPFVSLLHSIFIRISVHKTQHNATQPQLFLFLYTGVNLGSRMKTREKPSVRKQGTPEDIWKEVTGDKGK